MYNYRVVALKLLDSFNESVEAIDASFPHQYVLFLYFSHHFGRVWTQALLFI